MAGYRDDLEAVKARVTTLEAQLREKEAALQAREAELREVELASSRSRKPSQWSRRSVGWLVGTFATGALAAGLVAVVAWPDESSCGWMLPPEPKSGAPYVTIVTAHGNFACAIESRLVHLGFRRGSTWGTNFRTWKPHTDSELLLIALVLTGEPPFDDSSRDAYLPKPWTELQSLSGHGQLEGKSPLPGRRVIVLYGQTSQELRQAVAELEL